METKIKSLIIGATAIIELFTLQAWVACKSFTDIFHHSSINLQLQIEAYSNTENGTPLLLTRMFTNKITDNLINFLRFYLQFWDIRFGANWFSLIGHFGIFAGIYYIFTYKKKMIYHWIMLILILFLPWIEIFFEPPISLILKSIYLWLPFALFSLYGIYQFLNHGIFKKRALIILILFLVSIWWIIFLPYGLIKYCAYR